MTNHYEILSISEDASQQEIRRAYRQRAKDIHLPHLQGLKNKYQDAGEERLLRIIEEKIADAEEEMKLLNEAYEVLSDPEKRAEYDDVRGEQSQKDSDPAPRDSPPADISITPSSLDFGALLVGEQKTLAFTVKNRGGFAEPRRIDWEVQPEWAEDLTITYDPYDPFPIGVEITVDATGIPEGHKSQRILVVIENVVFKVDVCLEVELPKPERGTDDAAPDPPGRSSRVAEDSGARKPSRASKGVNLVGVILGGASVLACLLVAGGLAISNLTEETASKRDQARGQETRVAIGQTSEAAEEELQQELEHEAALVQTNPRSILQVKRLAEVSSESVYGEDYCESSEHRKSVCKNQTWARYALVNQSQHLILVVTSSGCRTEEWDQSRDSLAAELEPGAEAEALCREYWAASSEAEPPCWYISVDNLRPTHGDLCLRPGDIPQSARPLSSFVDLSMRAHREDGEQGRIDITLRVDGSLPHSISLDPYVDGGPPPGYRDWPLYVLQDGSYREVGNLSPGNEYSLVIYIARWSEFFSEWQEKCFGLASPYFEEDVVCAAIQQ